MNSIQLKDINVDFTVKEQTLRAIHGLNLSLQKGEILGVVGESGSGKSVASLAIMGLLPKYADVSGSITINGSEVVPLSERDKVKYRGNTVSMLFQDPMSCLNPVSSIGKHFVEILKSNQKTATDLVCEKIVENQGKNPYEAKEMALDLLTKVGISSPSIRYKEFAHEISGGMCQRVMIALALAVKPDYLIADEPTTALDVTIQAQIIDLLKTLCQQEDMGLLFITHDLGVVSQVADNLAVMYLGEIVEHGSCNEVLLEADHPYTKGLLNASPALQQTGEFLPIRGHVPSISELPKGCHFSTRCDYVFDKCHWQKPSLKTVGNKQIRCFLQEIPQHLHKEEGECIKTVYSSTLTQ